MKKRGLGKGLDALFQSYDSFESTEDTGSSETLEGRVLELSIYDIDPNPDQPRRNFEQDSIQDLSQSIMEHGVVQPIIVKPSEKDRYTIIAGERRWRAARAAGLNKIPAIVKDIDEKEMLELALIENLQREDLNPIEEAEGIHSLIDNYGLTQEQVAKRLGKSRPSITNALRLLRLPKQVRNLLEEGKITTGHARALLALNNQTKIMELAELIVEKNLSVRETENLIKNIKENRRLKKKSKTIEKPSFIMELESRMEESLGTKVTIQQGKKKGVIEIEYYGNDDLERIIKKISI
ncbi:MAG: ParB/RepB/Spo0J family partition protein [Caldicoprobacterales bacterium]